MKLFKYIGICLCAALWSACGNDWLDTEPTTSVPSEGSLTTLNDYEYTVNGIYGTMQSYYYYGARMQYYGDVTGDDMQATDGTKRCADYYTFSHNAGNAPSTFWLTCYSIIREANRMQEGIDEVSVLDDEEEEWRDDLKGQALALRALALFDLTRLYGYPYLKDDGASLGASIVKEVVEIDYQPKRSTVADCYAEIINDLETACPLLQTGKTKGKINRWGAMTLLSRAYLYKGDYRNAYDKAVEAIKGAEKKSYRLWTNEEYEDVWAQDFSSEVFFEVVNLLTDSPGKESMGYLCYSKGYADMALTSSFIDFLKQDPKDVRSKLYKEYKKWAYITKYPGEQGDGGPADANIKIFRLSELYLIAAEAAVKLNDNANAVKYLDEIVRRGNPANTVEGTTVTVERVLEERRKEFFGEGHRMFDVLRTGGTIKRYDVNVKGFESTAHLASNLQSYVWEFDWNMYKVVLPIPKAELDANPNMRGQQNPGY